MTPVDSRDASNWAERLERLARLVPGVGRYQDREGLRETDEQVRVHLAGRLTDLTRIIQEAERRLTEAGRLDRLPTLDRVARRLSTLADQVRHTRYGFAGVFDLHKIREAELAALHRFDLVLLEAVSGLRQPLQALADAVSDDTAFPQALDAADAVLQDFEHRVADRDRVARSL